MLSKVFTNNGDSVISEVTRNFRRDIDKLREIIWVIDLLTIEAFVKKPSHWKELFKELKMPEIEPNEDLTFAVLVQKQILTMRDSIEEISRRADKQWNLEKKLNEMQEKVKYVKIELQPYKNDGIYIFKSLDEL
jgi:dynein heavy chain